MPKTTRDRCITPSFSPSTYHRGKLMDGEQRDRTVAGERGAEMLQRVRAGKFGDALDERHLPIGAAFPPDNAAQRTPFRQVARRRPEPEISGRQATFIEVKAVARRAPGQPGSERGRPALEIAAGTENAVGVNHHAG